MDNIINKEFDLHSRWLGGEQIAGLRFMMNDYVVVISGKHIGASGSVVSVITFETNTLYIVEAESGVDIEVRESEIKISKP